MPKQDINTELVKHLKSKYFNDDNKQLFLKKGDYLIKQNEVNNRLFLILEGSVTGHLISDTGSKHEVFQTHKDMFVGVHSFFSRGHIVYANVVATVECKIAYINYKELTDQHSTCYHEDFLPLIVNELSVRQRFSKDIMLEKEGALKKLYHNEKMSTLGQMAAGLAHELNNAIGVLNGNSEWMAEAIAKYLKNNIDRNIYSDFQSGLNNGQSEASSEIRNRKKHIEKHFKMPSYLAKRMAKMALTDDDINAIIADNDIDKTTENKQKMWELGVALHDMLISSKHATHVLKSMKQLSSSDQVKTEVDINDTIKEALTIVKKVVQNINVELRLENLSEITANTGELIQVWVNLIKNACESMVITNTIEPTLKIHTYHASHFINVDITDNGPGVPDEIKEKIFQPNFTTKKDGLSFGLGLGLSIVQQILNNYNGKIQVESQKGNTKFTIQIPTA